MNTTQVSSSNCVISPPRANVFSSETHSRGLNVLIVSFMEGVNLDSLLNEESKWKELSSLLDHGNWRSLSTHLNITIDDNTISIIESPSRELLLRWKQREKVTVMKLVEALLCIEGEKELSLIASWLPDYSHQIQELLSSNGTSKRIKLEHNIDDTKINQPKYTADFHFFENLVPGVLPQQEYEYWQAMKLCWNDHAIQAIPILEPLDYPPAILRLTIIHKSMDREGAKYKKYRDKCVMCKDWFLKDALTGNPVAQFHMAAYYDVIERNLPMILFWEQKAAEAGFAPAQNRLGWCYEIGEGVPQNWTRAVYWYQKAADQHYIHAECNIAWCYEHGHGYEQDYSKALAGYHMAAEKGYGRGFYSLGLCYQDGNGVEKDLTKAVEWFKQGAEIGHARSQYKMGYYCYYGMGGLVSDEKEAYDWFQLAADAGVSHAQYFLGFFYEHGQNVEKNDKMAFHWYYRAAIQQDAGSAWFPTGYCYYHGKGVKKDFTQAVHWLKKAAEADDERAQHLLGLCYHAGLGVECDSVEALKWLKKAVDAKPGAVAYLRDYTNIKELHEPQKCTKEP